MTKTARPTSSIPKILQGTLSAHQPDLPSETTDKPASVLVPLINRPGGVTVLLTGRAQHLRTHAGQISFPGGRPEAGDRDMVHTALREAEEEIGLPQMLPKFLGYLDAYTTGTNFSITPVVCWVESLPPLTLNPGEVDYVFEMPLSYILDPNLRQTCRVLWQGAMRQYYVYDFEQRYIWGATAGMLSNLADKILSSHIQISPYTQPDI